MLLPQSRCLHCACIASEFSESCRAGRLLGSGSRHDINARASHRSGLVLDAVMSSILMPLSICILRMLAGRTLGSGSHHAISAHANVDVVASGGRSPTEVWQPSWHQRSCLSTLELVGCQIRPTSHYPINTDCGYACTGLAGGLLDPGSHHDISTRVSFRPYFPVSFSSPPLQRQ